MKAKLQPGDLVLVEGDRVGRIKWQDGLIAKIIFLSGGFVYRHLSDLVRIENIKTKRTKKRYKKSA